MDPFPSETLLAVALHFQAGLTARIVLFSLYRKARPDPGDYECCTKYILSILSVLGEGCCTFISISKPGDLLSGV